MSKQKEEMSRWDEFEHWLELRDCESISGGQALLVSLWRFGIVTGIPLSIIFGVVVFGVSAILKGVGEYSVTTALMAFVGCFAFCLVVSAIRLD